MFDIIKPALIRVLAYFAPILLGIVFAWAAAQGFGVYNESAGTWTITVSIAQITTAVVAFIGAPSLALLAVFRGWKGLGK